MKKYFAKYLPVEGNINGGEYYKSKKYPHLEAKVVTANWSKQILDFYDVQKVKLFLCSKDIQIGDKVVQDKEKSFNPNSLAIIDKEHLEMHKMYGHFKVIGEISPEATWVKEGDKFGILEVKIVGENSWGERHSIGLYKKRDNPKVYCEIKCPTCKHFH